MADTKITALAAIATVDPAADVLPIVDISDTSMAASGTTKKVTSNQILGAGGTATLASATITGDLTVDTSTLKVDSTNNRVGIGTASPGNALHVQASGDIARFTNGTLSAYLAIDSSGYTLFTGAGQTGNGLYAKAATNAVQLWTNGAQRYDIDSTGVATWSVAGTTAMTLDANGLGIGTTVYAAGTKFQIRTASNINLAFQSGTTHVTGIKLNAFNNAGSANIPLELNGSILSLKTGETERLQIDASGNLLVGVATNPNTARAYFRYDTLTTQPVINSASIVAASTSWSHFIGQSGNGSIVTTNDIYIYGNGNIQNVNGVYGTISDLRLKENVADARNYLSDLLKLRVVKYSLKEEASAVANKLGFIAQEVEQVFPAMVDTDPNDGNKGIKTSVLIPMLVKAIQELAARVQTLEAK